jgi:hypothetical protein
LFNGSSALGSSGRWRNADERFRITRRSRFEVQPIDFAREPAHNRNPKGNKTMGFMKLVKHGENPGPPPKEFTDAMATRL